MRSTDDMNDQSALDPRDDELSHLASAMLATRHFGIVWTRAISEHVGNDSTENASIACLSELRTGGPLRLRELTSRVQLPGPMLSRVVDRLVARGHVTRGPGPVHGDGRAVLITINKIGVQRERSAAQSTTMELSPASSRRRSLTSNNSVDSRETSSGHLPSTVAVRSRAHSHDWESSWELSVA